MSVAEMVKSEYPKIETLFNRNPDNKRLIWKLKGNDLPADFVSPWTA